MTYKINPEVSKILCPIILRFEDGEEKEFEDGKELAETVFDKHWNIKEYDVKGNKILITVYEFFEKAT